MLNPEKIELVSKVLEKPTAQLHLLKSLAVELCNYNFNIRCSSCVTESVIHLGNWLKQQGKKNEFTKLAMQGKYDLAPINLFVNVYKSENKERQKELDVCLKINKSLNTNGVPFFNIIEIKERLTFKEMFKLAKENEINIFSNSDIFFNETILWSRFMHENEAYCLSRWDYKTGGVCELFNRKDSQDVWIFKGKVKENIGGDYQMGVRGCDNRLAFELRNSGYQVLNPAKTIHAIHLHQSNFRTYNVSSPAVPEPYYFIKPHY